MLQSYIPVNNKVQTMFLPILIHNKKKGDPKMRKGLLFAKRSFILRKGLLLWLNLFIRIMFDI